MPWRKYFEDGEKILATDADEDRGKISWSKSRFDGMVAAEIGYGGQTAIVHIPGSEWHQFDRMVVPVGEGTHKPKKIAKTIQAEIKIEHTDGYIVETTQSKYHKLYVFKDKRPEDLEPRQKLYKIDPKHFSKWFTVTIMEDGPGWAECKYIVSITDKGKMS